MEEDGEDEVRGVHLWQVKTVRGGDCASCESIVRRKTQRKTRGAANKYLKAIISASRRRQIRVDV